MKSLLKTGITSNMVKTIAIIAMVIDHIGFYFSYLLPNPIYVACRIIGRIAMPLFTYLLVQGFFHTRSLKNYIRRIFGLAVITQLIIIILMTINVTFIPQYISAKQIYMNGNILFTFTISLIVLGIIHKDLIMPKWTYNKNLSFKIVVVFLIIILSAIAPLDYGKEGVLLSIFMYFIEKFRLSILIGKNGKSLKSGILKMVPDKKIKMVYLTLIAFSLILVIMYFNKSYMILFSLIPIALYNEELGKSNKFVKNLYYIIFPLQHCLLYLIAMLIMLT